MLGVYSRIISFKMLSYSTGQCKFGETFLESEKLLSKNIQQKIYRTKILSVVLYGYKTSSLILRAERRLWLFENRILIIFGPKTDGVTRKWRKIRKKLNDSYSSSNSSKPLGWAESMTCLN
jgi:hypothetical protein